MSRLEELADGVFAWIQPQHDLAHPNAGVIVDDDGITVVDTLLAPSQAEPFGDAVDDLGLPVRRVVLTSSHVSFVGGTERFALAARYGRGLTSAHLDQPPNVAGWRATFPDHADEWTDDLLGRGITHVIDEPAWLTPRALAVPVAGQQHENLVVQVPDANVLLAGALGAFGTTPAAWDGDPGTWAETVAPFGDWGAVIVPGVGPVGDARRVLEQQAYLFACVEAIDGCTTIPTDAGALPAGPWEAWSGREHDLPNIERAWLLAADDDTPPPTMLSRMGLGPPGGGTRR